MFRRQLGTTPKRYLTNGGDSGTARFDNVPTMAAMTGARLSLVNAFPDMWICGKVARSRQALTMPSVGASRHYQPITGNFVHEQNGHRRQCGPDGQRVTSEEVQGHTYPAKANSYQGTTNIRRSDCCREGRAKDVPEPRKLS